MVRMSKTVQSIETDVIVFGFGPITREIIKNLMQNNNSIICVTSNQGNHKGFKSPDNIRFLTRDEIVSHEIISKSTIFSWRNSLPLLESSRRIQDWIDSSLFNSGRSILLSSASVYADSKNAQNEGIGNLNSQFEENVKFILETNLSQLLLNKSIPHLNVRISNAYGSKVTYGFIGELIRSIHTKTPVKIYSETEILRDYIFTNDISSGIADLLTLDFENSIVNMSTGIGSSIEDVLEIFESKGYHFEDRISESATSEIAKASILDCTLLRSLINWAPKNLVSGLTEVFSEEFL